MKIVLATGGFDPIHSGHILYLNAARKLGDKLVVGLNSDAWLARKKGRPFMPYNERRFILENLKLVDQVIDFNDDDGTACHAIFKVLSEKNPRDIIIFANGGDRVRENIPECIVYSGASPVKFEFGVGGDNKANSSSWILEEWRAAKTVRNWGYYKVLYEGEGFKVKELVINPHSKLSMQRHQYRSETWNIVSGEADIITNHASYDPFDGAYVYQKDYNDPFDGSYVHHLHRDNPFNILPMTWHQGINNTDKPAHIIEIWKGPNDKLNEDDIQRYYNS